MNQLISTIRRSGRAALVALAFGAASLGALATPAVAQSPSFNFQFQVPGGSVEFGTQNQRSDRDRDLRWERDRDRYCLSDRRITRELREEGWRNIEFGRELRRNRVEIVAQYGRSYYKLIADRCDGDIRVVERLRTRRGIGFQFNFGN